MRQPTAICKSCGVTATAASPVKCAVCGATDFDHISAAMLERIGKREGGVEEETTYDGRSLGWTVAARTALREVSDKDERRRAKARIEKGARLKKLDPVPLEFVRRVIAEVTGRNLPEIQDTPLGQTPAETNSDGRRIVATDGGGNALWSTRKWTDTAIERVLRVPAGFMRNKTQERVEELAADRDCDLIDLELVEAGIEIGRQTMTGMVKGRQRAAADEPSREAFEAGGRSGEQEAGTLPSPASKDDSSERAQRYGEGHYSQGKPSLNEAGAMRAKATSDLSVTDKVPDAVPEDIPDELA